ncbi:MAG: gamma-glutamylcyclotransferase family protein [Verrucomicrobiota bacterium JB022]|nr:gamma-glutamylcyclotransferase family protein [Verrucomicrobiota bacterium JB022]
MSESARPTLVFVYGTLKTGGTNHHYLKGQKLLGEARTEPGYRLYVVADYPGLVADRSDQEGVQGELWAVDAATLPALDELEGLDEGLYAREPIQLQAPFDRHEVVTYYYLFPVAGCPTLPDGNWPVHMGW